MNETVVLEISQLQKTYNKYLAHQVPVLRGVDLTLHAGEVVGMIAPSGAGKSTLLHIAGLLDTPDAGDVRLNGRSVLGLSDRARTAIRCHEVGFIYQFNHLLPEFSALENIMLPQLVNWQSQKQAKSTASDLLEQMGLLARADHRPAAL